MDEYEVKVHAVEEDIEEGEVTSDEEGEIKGLMWEGLSISGFGNDAQIVKLDFN